MQTVTIGLATLHLGDCRELLPMIVADAIVSDPPYGIGYVRGNAAKRKGWRGGDPNQNTAPIIGDEKPFDPVPLLRFENLGYPANPVEVTYK